MLFGLHPPNRATLRLGSVVVVWWLLVVGMVAIAATELPGTDEGSAVVPGQAGHIATPTGGAWLIPVDRATYYEVERPALDEDEDAPTDVPTRPGWLAVVDGQAVRVVDVDRAAAQVELLEEPNVGGQGWVHLDYLRP